MLVSESISSFFPFQSRKGEIYILAWARRAMTIVFKSSRTKTISIRAFHAILVLKNINILKNSELNSLHSSMDIGYRHYFVVFIKNVLNSLRSKDFSTSKVTEKNKKYYFKFFYPTKHTKVPWKKYVEHIKAK